MNSVVISLNNVSKSYKLYESPADRLKESLHPFGKKYHKKFTALHNINLEVSSGEILGIIGKNGSGKSTLLKLITGVLTPSAGKVETKGKISALLELGAGFNPDFTGVENIYFYSMILGLERKQIDEIFDDIVAFADIGVYMNQPLKTYSSGMRSRLAFSVVIHLDPDILILDEVLAVGDVQFRRKCFSKMEKFFDSGKTIIYVSHDENSINSLCTRAIFLDQGDLLLDAVPKVTTKYYQKYIFSQNDAKDSVRSEIIEYAEKHERSETIDGTIDEDQYEEESYYLPDFVTKNLVKISNYDVDIYGFCITDRHGEKKNVLKFGERYTYSFIVSFESDVSEAGIGSQIKSIKGMTISLASTNTVKHRSKVIKKGKYKVEWSFDCLLMQGVYYFDTSVSGEVDSQRELLCRCKDCFVFKVMPVKDSLYQGLVSLGQEIEILSV